MRTCATYRLLYYCLLEAKHSSLACKLLATNVGRGASRMRMANVQCGKCPLEQLILPAVSSMMFGLLHMQTPESRIMTTCIILLYITLDLQLDMLN